MIRVTFLINSYNEERMINAALSSFFTRGVGERGDCEILLEIDGTDNTYAFARRWQKVLPNLKIWKPRKRMGRVRAFGFLVEQARSDIIVESPVDRLFAQDVDRIISIFKDRRLGGLVQVDEMSMDVINDGQKFFEKTYERLKLERYLLRNNEIRNPSFSVHTFRKSALKPPYIETPNDDTEITLKLLMNGYKVKYVPDLYWLMDNPAMQRLTPSGIIKRRVRTELFKRDVRARFGTDEFRSRNNIDLFFRAALIALTQGGLRIGLETIEYLLLVAVATINAKVQVKLNPELNAWNMRTR